MRDGGGAWWYEMPISVLEREGVHKETVHRVSTRRQTRPTRYM